MKKKLIKRIEELAIENEIQKQEISKLNNMLGKEEPKEEEVWWMCKKSYFEFTKGNKYKQINHSYSADGGVTSIVLIADNNNSVRIYKGDFKNFTKVEANKELEEAKEVVKDWRFGKCSYSSNEIDKAIETILKHLDNENKELKYNY